MEITINPQIQRAYQFIESTSANLFLTGKAGTGKTTFLKYIRDKIFKRMIIVAPTGVAAVNAGGVTIHSFFQLAFAPYIPQSQAGTAPAAAFRMSRSKIRIIESLELLVIDEVSMVRADVMDAIDNTLRRYRRNQRPFGGVQLLMIGDVHQLAPVLREEEMQLLRAHYASAYFFHSKALMQSNYLTIELETIYRQSDPLFTDILNGIRENRLDTTLAQELHRRYIPGFTCDDDQGYIRLSTHIAQAESINQNRLETLQTEAYCYKATITGNFPENSYPCDAELILKEGAQVMFLRNDKRPEKRYYNGRIGKVVRLSERNIEVMLSEGDSNETIVVEKELWENTTYTLDEDTKEIKEQIEGTFEQYPLRTAWAITIHKSQGLTFEKAIIDLSGAFAYGQVYVALSRCKTLEGLVLTAPVRVETITSDSTIYAFEQHTRSNRPNETMLEEYKRSYFLEKLLELFDFDEFRVFLFRISDTMRELLLKVYPKFVDELTQYTGIFHKEVCEVSLAFRKRLTALVSQKENYITDEYLCERIRSGATYFSEKLSVCMDYINRCDVLEVDNRSEGERLRERLSESRRWIEVKQSLLRLSISEGFSPSGYNRCYYLNLLENPDRKQKRVKASQERVTSDIVRHELMQSLLAWRKDKAQEQGVPEYAIVQRKAIIEMQALCPTTVKSLGKIKGIGKVTLTKYGDELLSIIQEHLFEPSLCVQEQGADSDVSLVSSHAPKKKKKTGSTQNDLTHIKSYQLFKQGLEVKAIAKERNLSPTTIVNHLARCVRDQLLSPFDLVQQGKYNTIRECLQANPESKMSFVKELLGEAYSYADIIYVRAHLEVTKTQ